MSIPIDTYCLQCLLRRNIALAQTLGTEEQAMAFAKEIMKLCIAAPEGVSSPWFGPQIADLLHDMYGLDYDRFRQEKLDSNHFVLERLPMIRKRVTESRDPVLAGTASRNSGESHRRKGPGFRGAAIRHSGKLPGFFRLTGAGQL